jgi:hypothetical protein
MPHEVDRKLSREKPLGYFFVLLFLPGYHLHNRQGKPQRPRLRLSLGKCPDGNSILMWKGVGDYFKFLTIDADSLRLRIAHSLELIADFMHFD